MGTMTSWLLQDRWALTSKQTIGDQGPYRCNVFTGHQWSSQVACGQPRGQSTHTDIHIQRLESSFKVFYTSYTNWRKSPTAVLYCHWNWGEIFFNLITKGKNVVLGQFVSPNATVTCTPALVDAIPTSHSAPWQRLCRGYEVVIIHSRSLFNSQMSKVRPAHLLRHTAHTAQPNVRVLGL